MGRLSKPTNLKVLDGERADRINVNEPQPPEGLGEPPNYLHGYGLEKWNELKAVLETMKVATQADRDAAAIYCEAFQRWRYACDVIRFGEVRFVPGKLEPDGYGGYKQGPDEQKTFGQGYVLQGLTTEVENKYLKIAERAEERLLTIGRYFGLTPVARTQLQVTEGSADDVLTKYVTMQAAKLQKNAQ